MLKRLKKKNNNNNKERLFGGGHYQIRIDEWIRNCCGSRLQRGNRKEEWPRFSASFPH